MCLRDCRDLLKNSKRWVAERLDWLAVLAASLAAASALGGSEVSVRGRPPPGSLGGLRGCKNSMMCCNVQQGELTRGLISALIDYDRLIRLMLSILGNGSLTVRLS